MRALTRRRRPGFTLIEVSLVLAILGLLLAFAKALMEQRVMRARRAEAVLGLHGIHRAQVLYRELNGGYGDTLDEIGFEFEGGKRLDARTWAGGTYTFTVKALPLDDDPRGNFQAVATGDLDPSDAVLDILMIENGLEVVP